MGGSLRRLKKTRAKVRTGVSAKKRAGKKIQYGLAKLTCTSNDTYSGKSINDSDTVHQNSRESACHPGKQQYQHRKKNLMMSTEEEEEEEEGGGGGGGGGEKEEEAEVDNNKKKNSSNHKDKDTNIGTVHVCLGESWQESKSTMYNYAQEGVASDANLALYSNYSNNNDNCNNNSDIKDSWDSRIQSCTQDEINVSIGKPRSTGKAKPRRLTVSNHNLDNNNDDYNYDVYKTNDNRFQQNT